MDTKNNLTQSREVLFLVLPEYADWEVSLLAPGLRGGLVYGNQVLRPE